MADANISWEQITTIGAVVGAVTVGVFASMAWIGGRIEKLRKDSDEDRARLYTRVEAVFKEIRDNFVGAKEFEAEIKRLDGAVEELNRNHYELRRVGDRPV